MKKGWIIAVAIVAVLSIGVYIIVKLLTKEAFGPKQRTVEIELKQNGILIGNETYSADLADVTYQVDFSLKENDGDITNIGKASFTQKNWSKDISVREIDDWVVIPVKHEAYVKLLLANKNLGAVTDTVFSPLNLRSDSLWETKYNDFPAMEYTGLSQIDSIVGNSFYISYEYRIGQYVPFKFYEQSVEYKMNTSTGNYITSQIFERKEKP